MAEFIPLYSIHNSRYFVIPFSITQTVEHQKSIIKNKKKIVLQTVKLKKKRVISHLTSPQNIKCCINLRPHRRNTRQCQLNTKPSHTSISLKINDQFFIVIIAEFFSNTPNYACEKPIISEPPSSEDK